MVSFSIEKDEIFRDGELRKHPFWISGGSKGCSDRGRMVNGCDDMWVVVFECSKVNRGERRKKQAPTGDSGTS
jgi:hypothetical protein